jgi:SAM-dependent methyltransferase
MSWMSERLRQGRRAPLLRGAPRPFAADFAREFPLGPLALEGQPVTRILFERLDSEVVAEVERRAAESPDAEAWKPHLADPAVREWAVLCIGVWLGVPAVAEQTGLVAAQPPDNVHAMARGPLVAAGGIYEANLVVSGLASAGVTTEGVRGGLDFGCSSGRVVRVLAAAYPEVSWRGCDPNEPAIAWARHNLPGIDFFVNGNEPPLPLDQESLDLVLAVSVWSHFEPELGRRWFEEMRRVIRPGGHLVITTHGLTSIAHEAARELRGPEDLREIARSLYRQGWWYRPEFGEAGDWGVVNPSWGTAFLSPEWLLGELCPRWRVAEFAAGRNQGNQDVYVLERV